MELEFTREDFLNTTAPFEEVYRFHGDPFQEKRVLEQVAELAKRLKVVDFKKTYQAYVRSLKLAAETVVSENVTQFDQQELELDTGEWTADDNGVWRYGGFGGLEVACAHPIMPVERLRNIDTGEMKVRLAFRRGTGGRRAWTEVTADFDTVANARNVVALARIGVSVTSGKRAQNLVDYLTEVMDRNYDLLPERKSVSRMGWNEEGFAPYVRDLVFDGNDKFARTFQAIRPHGLFDCWLAEARRVRQYSLCAKIVLAASFASALVGPLGCLPFFVHLWGMDSGTGKTVAQMVAASVWADPAVGGEYFKTFKSTSVGFEILAGFLHSLPLFLDELQLAKDNRGRVIFNVYELASGSGKMRSNKALGLASTPTWANCFITSGETPMTGDTDGAGALNRVIEIECRADNKVIEDGHRTSETMKRHYGHAGQRFIEGLSEEGAMDAAKDRYEQLFKAFSARDTTEKQAMSAALIVLADELATAWIFQDEAALTVEEMADFLKSRATVSAAERGYQYMCDWVAQNANKLCGRSDIGEVYGDMGRGADEGWAYIVRSVWNRACQEAGISPPALLSHLRSRQLIKCRGRNLTMAKRINGIPTECVMLRLAAPDLEAVPDVSPWEEQQRIVGTWPTHAPR